MKKFAVIVIALAVVVYAMPVFAGDAGCAKGTEKSAFQLIADTVTVKGTVKDRNKLKIVPPEQVNVFQGCADGIKEGSAKAKETSLRTK